jgi:hypothetical protein
MPAGADVAAQADATAALVIASGHYPQRHRKIPAFLLGALYTDRVFWALNTFTPRRLWGFAAWLPKNYDASTTEEKTIRAVTKGAVPDHPQKQRGGLRHDPLGA